jgi:hypothetical protein
MKIVMHVPVGRVSGRLETRPAAILAPRVQRQIPRMLRLRNKSLETKVAEQLTAATIFGKLWWPGDT